MKQHAFEFDTSVAAEGFRQIQAANEQPFSREPHDAWLEQFLANACKAFGLPVRNTGMAALAQQLEQLGYFGFAHYLTTHARLKAVHMPPPRQGNYPVVDDTRKLLNDGEEGRSGDRLSKPAVKQIPRLQWTNSGATRKKPGPLLENQRTIPSSSFPVVA